MVYTQRVVVTEIRADFDPMGGEYTQVCFGYKLPLPRPPGADQQYPPAPRPVMYKHAVHIIFPREKWEGQFTMWGEYELRIEDNGDTRITRSALTEGG